MPIGIVGSVGTIGAAGMEKQPELSNQQRDCVPSCARRIPMSIACAWVDFIWGV